MERNYKELPLHQEKLNLLLEQFFEGVSKYKVRSQDRTGKKLTLKFGCPSQDDATVILFFTNKGTTTIQYKTGKNHQLGKELADFLFDTIDPNEKLSANLSLKGIDDESLEVLLGELGDLCDADGEKELVITRHKVSDNSRRFEVVSRNYKDRVTLTHHFTNILQIQGKPLFCYRNLTYFLAMFLDQESLISVISKTTDEERPIVHTEVAQVFIEKEYENSFPRMAPVYQDLLVSSYCVKLAAPKLPEYSMLLYADLRILEGVIKEVLMRYDKYTNSDRLDIGYYFSSTDGNSSLKDEHHNDFDTSTEINALERCYQLYRKQRHALFHMSEFADAARTTNTLGEVMSLSHDIACKVEDMYKACKKL